MAVMEATNKQYRAEKEAVELEFATLKLKYSELFEDNAKLNDNIAMMHQKFSDELLEQNAAKEEAITSPSRPFDKMALTGRNVSVLGEEEHKLAPPVKK